MQVISGAGEFEINIQRVEVRGSIVVLIGKMGVWESETIIEQSEIGHLIRVSLRPRVLGWVLAWPFAGLWRWLRHLKN